MATPKKYLPYQREARKVLVDWYKTQDVGFFRMLHNFAGDVYNRGDGLVFLDFDERRQRCFLKSEYVAWMKEMSHQIGKALERLESFKNSP